MSSFSRCRPPAWRVLHVAHHGCGVHQRQTSNIIGLFKAMGITEPTQETAPPYFDRNKFISEPCVCAFIRNLFWTTHFVNPLPSRRTTIQQAGRSLSSSSKLFTYSKREFAM